MLSSNSYSNFCQTLTYPTETYNVHSALRSCTILLVCRLYDQMDCQAVLDAVLVERVPVFQYLPRKDQNQLILLGFEPPRDLLLKLGKEKDIYREREEGWTARERGRQMREERETKRRSQTNLN